MEVNARFQNHARVLAVSEIVLEAQPRDLGVTDAAILFFQNFVQEVAATAGMAKIKATPESTAQRALRRSSRISGAASFPPPEAAAVAAPEINPPVKVQLTSLFVSEHCCCVAHARVQLRTFVHRVLCLAGWIFQCQGSHCNGHRARHDFRVHANDPSIFFSRRA